MSEKSNAPAEDLGGGFVLLTLGIVVIVAANENPWASESGAIGPAAVPGACGALLAILGVFQLGFTLRERRHSAVESRTTTEMSADDPADAAAASTLESHSLDDVIDVGDGAVQRGPREEPAGSEDPAMRGKGSLRGAFLAWFGVLVAAIAFARIGALVTVTLLAAYLLAVVGRKGWRTTTIYTAVLAGAVYLIFVVLLNIPMPTNPWIG